MLLIDFRNQIKISLYRHTVEIEFFFLMVWHKDWHIVSGVLADPLSQSNLYDQSTISLI